MHTMAGHRILAGRRDDRAVRPVSGQAIAAGPIVVDQVLDAVRSSLARRRDQLVLETLDAGRRRQGLKRSAEHFRRRQRRRRADARQDGEHDDRDDRRRAEGGEPANRHASRCGCVSP